MRRFSLALILALAMPAVASATYTAYSNTTHYSGSAYANGGAATDSANAANTITTLVADDITTVAGSAGGAVTGFTFSVADFEATAVSARARIRFYTADPTTGAPATYITGLTFNAISFGSGVGLFTYNPGTTIFTIPAGGTFYAGITFDNNGGTTGATASDLNNLGQGIFAPPTIGSSQDSFFQTTANGSFTSNSPAGGFGYFGGNPVADFGWSFNVAGSAVPEPSSIALVGLGLAGMVGARLRKRLARA